MIAISQLTRCFGVTTAVDQLSLDARPGEIFGVLGHNGAGKTTTVRLLNGLLEPTSRHLRVLGPRCAGFQLPGPPCVLMRS